MQMSDLINLEANQEFQSNVYLDEISSLFLDTLGQLALFLVMHALNGYMSTIKNMNQPISRWRCGEFHSLYVTLYFRLDTIIFFLYLDYSLLTRSQNKILSFKIFYQELIYFCYTLFNFLISLLFWCIEVMMTLSK